MPGSGTTFLARIPSGEAEGEALASALTALVGPRLRAWPRDGAPFAERATFARGSELWIAAARNERASAPVLELAVPAGRLPLRADLAGFRWLAHAVLGVAAVRVMKPGALFPEPAELAPPSFAMAHLRYALHDASNRTEPALLREVAAAMSDFDPSLRPWGVFATDDFWLAWSRSGRGDRRALLRQLAHEDLLGLPSPAEVVQRFFREAMDVVGVERAHAAREGA